MNDVSNIIECHALSRRFDDGRIKADVLQGIDLQVRQGERIAVIGRSGAGKSTLLHLLGGLDTPTSGEVMVDGVDISRLGQAARGRLRNRALGFVYQFHHLLPEFTAEENVAMPLVIGGKPPAYAIQSAKDILGKVGLSHRLKHKPSEMSGGERQRAAIARALVTRPKCVLADEPTGNLDHKNANEVYELMLELNIEDNTSFVIVTHDEEMASRMDRVLMLDDGVLSAHI